MVIDFTDNDSLTDSNDTVALPAHASRAAGFAADLNT
jgi:hypothetical protein